MTQFFKLQLAQSLTQDFLKEGFLFKTGPKPSDGFKRRWFTLDGRKLMYHDQKLVNKCLTMNLICNKFNSMVFFFSNRILTQKEKSLSATQVTATVFKWASRSVGNSKTWVSFFTWKRRRDRSSSRPRGPTTVTNGWRPYRRSWID